MIRSNNAEEKKLPKAVIIGVKKCGTGALMEMLKMHPQVAVPAYAETEVKFWGYDDLFKLGLPYHLVRKVGPSKCALQKSSQTTDEKCS